MTAKKSLQKRPPREARRAILEAAKAAIASDGTERLNVSNVARAAGVNRSTAYEHFTGREELLRATLRSVGEELCQELFFGTERETEYLEDFAYQEEMLEKFGLFLMNNSKLARAWLFDVLHGEERHEDPLWGRWNELALKFTRSGKLQPNLDGEVLSVAVIGALFVWTLWVQPEKQTTKSKKELARRFARALRKMSVLGVYLPREVSKLTPTL